MESNICMVFIIIIVIYFEFSDSAQIITHARDIPGSVRRKESKRKRERERKKAKKQALKEQKLEEIKRLKNEKRKEIHERLLEIQKITGTGGKFFVTNIYIYTCI